MTCYTKRLFTILAVGGIMVVAVGSASATQLSVNSTTFRFAWASLELGNTAGLGNVLRCPLTLEGSFHSSTIAKVARSLIGLVTTARTGTCTGGTTTIHQESLPWHLTYESFAGTLPNITGVSLLFTGAFFEINNGAATCSARTETRNNAAAIARLDATGRVTNIVADRTHQIPLTGGLCALVRGYFEGEGTVTQLNSTTGVIITLVGPPSSSLTPNPVAFGAVEPGELARRTVTITAGGAATVNSIRVTAGNYFAITDPNRCVGARLAERGTCRFSVIFAAPGEAGRSVEDTVSVETNLETLRVAVRGST
jgi:hypothetical protein